MSMQFNSRPHDRSNQKHKQESDNERKPFNRRPANSSPSASRQSTPRDKKTGVLRRNRVRRRRSVSSVTVVVEKAILPGSAHQGMIVRTWMKSEQSRPVIMTVICLVWIGAMTPIVTINSVTEQNDRTRGGKELLAYVNSGAVDNVLPKSVCTEYLLEAISKSQSGVGFKGANGSHIKHYVWAPTHSSQDLRSCGCAQAVDLCQSSARERSQACIGRNAEDPVQEWRHNSA